MAGCPLSRRLSRPPAAICPKPASRPRKLRLSRELAEKNIRLSRRENCGLNTKKFITNLFPQVIRQSPWPALPSLVGAVMFSLCLFIYKTHTQKVRLHKIDRQKLQQCFQFRVKELWKGAREICETGKR